MDGRAVPVTPTRVAAVDCGTNSLRLLVADLDPTRRTLTDVVRRVEVVRLGQGVDSSGRLHPEAIGRVVATTGAYAETCRALGVSRARFVATSAARDAANGAELLGAIADTFARTGLAVVPEILSGDEEAALSFAGATGELTGAADDAPHLLVDLGGGSTEFVLGADAPSAAISIDVGSVRLTERLRPSDPPTETEIDALRAVIGAELDRVAEVVDLSAPSSVVGVAGTVTTVTAHALGLSAYDSERVHLSVLPVDKVVDACDSLVRMTVAERAGLPFLQPGREDVIGAGALIWQCVVERVAAAAGVAEVVTSEHDILDGIALSLG